MPKMRGVSVYRDISPGLETSRRPDRGSRGRTTLMFEDSFLDAEALDYALGFETNELVLARHPVHNTWWPGIILDPGTEAPEHVLRGRERDRPLCVMFYGPGQHRTRDFVWAAGEGDLLPLAEYVEDLKRARESRPSSKGHEYFEAIDEVLLVKRGLRDRIAGALDGDDFGHLPTLASGVQGGRSHGRQHGPTHCTSCDTQLDNFEMANARQLNGRCSSCHELFRKGNYCPVCEKVWLSSDKDMVGCDTCSFWVHTHCDRLAAKAMASGEDMDYYCPHCRKLRNINARLAALQQAENAVRTAEPRPPRSAFHLFAAEIHKQYNVDTIQDMTRVVGDTWRSLTMLEREPYEMVAQQEVHRHLRDKRIYEDLQRRYAELRFAAEQDGIIDEDGMPVKVPKLASHRPASGTLNSSYSGGVRTTAGGHRPPPSGGTPRAAYSSPPPLQRSSSGKRQRREPSPDYVPQPSKKKRERLHSPQPRSEPAGRGQPAGPPPDAPEEIPVFCNAIHGILLLRRQRVLCQCKECAARPEGSQEFSCTQFEQHCGAGSAKKWKASLRIVPGGVPEVPAGSAAMPVGKWMEVIGMDARPIGGRSGPVAPSSAARPTNLHQQSLAAAMSPNPMSPAAPRQARKEEKDALFEPWLDIKKGNYKPLKVRWAGDRCSVCDSDVDFDFDQLVSCDQCGITVHQSCYGVPELPGEDDLWLCRSCEFKEEGEEAPPCCLCPVSGGALKQTTEADLWCHAACMQWIPEVTVEDINRMEPISHIRSIQKERWDLNCCICKQRVGAKIQCSSCYTAYHPLCGRIAGLHMEMVDQEGGGEGAVRLISYCPRHCTPKPQMSGVRLVSKEEEGRQKVKGDDGNGLWNAQLFPPPTLVPVPDCPSGSARMEPLQSQGWVRVSHGTGMGHSSTAGFWIPKKPLQLALQALPKPSKPAKRKTGGSAGFGRSRLGSSSRPRPSEGAPDSLDDVLDADSSDLARQELEPVELMPLPEGVAEEVPVHCNGRSALLLVRMQRVRYGGQDISASKFEALCGKGDAKKWKCSLWLEDEAGEPVMMMQDWLNEKKLDRKVLANLAANLAAAEAYQQFCAMEVVGVLREVLDAVEDEEGGSPAEGAEGEDPPSAQGEPQNTAQAPWSHGSPPDTGEEPAAMEVDEPTDNGPAAQLLDTEADLAKKSREWAAASLGGNGAASQTAAAPPEIGKQHTGEGPGGVAANKGGRSACAGEGVSQEGRPPAASNPQGSEEKVGDESSAEAAEDADILVPPLEANGPAQEAGEGQQEPEGAEEMSSSRLRPRQGPLQTPRPTVAPANGTPGAAAAAPVESASSGPESVLGQHCEVHFLEDREWYRAVVRGYDRTTKLHNLWYYFDEEAEWIDLLEEDRAGRVRWANPAMSANLRGTGDQKKQKLPPIQSDALHGEPPPTGLAAVGWRVAIWWKDDACYYKGRVLSYDPESGRHKVLYEDGENEHLVLSAEHVRWDRRPHGSRVAPPPPRGTPPPRRETPPPSRAASPPSQGSPPPSQGSPPPPRNPMPQPASPTAAASQQLPRLPTLMRAEATEGSQEGPSPAVAADASVPVVEDKASEEARLQKAASAPSSVRVVCNSMRGTFLTQRSAVQMENGQVVSPTEFERVSGKAASKKWKASIRIDKGNGAPGITIGDWLVDKGLDAPKAPRVRSETGAIRHQRQSFAMRSAAAATNRSAGKQGHRESCMCVICKQARRTGRPWAGMLGAGAAPVWIPTPSLASANLATQPRKSATAATARYGKRAFVRCTAQLLRGPIRNQPWQAPKSKAHTAEEWDALHADPAEAKSSRHTPTPSDAAAASKAEPGEEAATAVVKQEAGEGGGAAVVKERRGLTVKERLEICQATERQRLTFCKSGIHGWGLIARQEMKQDSMIIEYRGESLRRSMADAREKAYRAKDMDCYLFNINDDVVIDATVKGTIGRFTNHCCAPSMYTKVVEVDGQPHLVFFARQDIRIGQELTYDYRFKEEEGENKLVCHCGAPNCRGFMN